MKYPGLVLTAFMLPAFISSCFSPGTTAQAESPAVASAHDTTDVPAAAQAAVKADSVAVVATLDTSLYNLKMEHMLNGDSSGKWPVKTPYPLPGAILPFKTVIAFYGNLYSRQMGILG